MTGDDLRRLQDDHLEAAKKRLMEKGRLSPVGFVVTLREHLDKLSKSGWGTGFIAPEKRLPDLPDARSDGIATLVVDLLMDPRRLYHAVLNVFPETRRVLPQMIALGGAVGVDDAYTRVMSAFLNATGLHEKDVIAATMRQICGQVHAFACILYWEAWMRDIDPSDTAAVERASRQGLANDQSAFEVIFSPMETYDFTRVITVPVERQKSSKTTRRDGGKVIGFGKAIDGDAKFEGRLASLLKPLGVAS